VKLLLSMGLKPHGHIGEPLAPRLRVLDVPSGEVHTLSAREMPAAHHPSHQEHAEFTGARRGEQHLLQTTRTEVLWLDWPSLQVARTFSHPLFHDVHDAIERPHGGFAVTSSGLDSVLEFTAQGELLHHHYLGQGPFEARFGGYDDYRNVPFDHFKPHPVHPNSLFHAQGELWTTTLMSEEALCVTRPALGPLPFPEGGVHDGQRQGDHHVFTTVSGWVIFTDPSLRRVRALNLRAIEAPGGHPGWCRGVALVGEYLFVGMTMLRDSRHREALRQLLRPWRGRKLPTRVLQIHLPTERLVASYPVGNEAGGTLYALHPWPGSPG